MKTIKSLLFAILALIPLFANADIVKENGNYVVVKSTSTKSANIADTGKTFTDTKGNVYPIMINKNTGSCFVIKTSQKTGKEYKQYLGIEISKEIAKEFGVKYKAKQNEKVSNK